MGVKCENAHTKSGSDPCRLEPDSPETDDSHCFACQFNKRVVPEAPIRIPSPFSFHNCITMALNMMAMFKQQCKYHLGHRFRAISRNVADDDPPFFCNLRIHYIKACCQNPN